MALLDENRPTARLPRWPAASDEALVRGSARGADGAFEEIFARYHAPLVRYCRGILLDDDAAQDAAQAALAGALRALLGGTSVPHSLGPWLYRIAQREAVALARRRRQDAAARRHAGADGEDPLLSVAAPSDERTRERLRELLGDLAQLPLRQRSALLLRELSGLDYADIAIALETSPAAARQSVLEARGALSEAEAGRASGCHEIRALMDAGDRRRLRGRRVRAHLHGCAPCRAFAARTDTRHRDLALLFPLAPAALASGGGALAAVTGGGAAAGGAAAAGGWTFGLGGLGASGAAKCALACTAALVGGGALAERVVVHAPVHRPPVQVIAQAPQPATAVPTEATTATAAPAPATARRPRAASHTRTVRASGRPAVRRAVALPRPAASSLGSAQPAATTPAPAPAPAPAATTAAPAAPTPAAAPVATQSRQQLLAAELRRRLQEEIARRAAAALAAAAPAPVATTSTRPSLQQLVEQSTAAAQQLLSGTQQTVQQLTTATLSGMQAQLAALRERLLPTTQP